jgi:natural product biosynthesis luciferase-like monooxygenase protein
VAVRCVFVGDEPLVEQCADIARQHGLEVALIVTANPIVRQWAEEFGIAVVAPGDETAGLDEHPADVLFSIANLRVLRGSVLDRVATAINFHDGPLPAYAGRNVTTWALLAGERHHGITWHLMTADVDAGSVVASETFPIAEDETAFALNARCYEGALATFPRVAAALAAGTLTSTPQPPGERRLFRRHDRPALVLDPKAPAEQSARAVRAVDYGHRLRNAIGAVRLVLGDAVYVVDGARAREPLGSYPPGTIAALDGDGMRIATGDGDLFVTALSTPEGAATDVVSVARGHGLKVGATVPSPAGALVAAIAELEPQLARHEVFWLDRLTETLPTVIPGATTTPARSSLELPTGADHAAVLAAVGVWLSRIAGTSAVSFAVSNPEVRSTLARIAPLARPPLVRLDVPADVSFASIRAAAAEELELVSAHGPLLHDAIGRDPRLRGGDLPAPALVELRAGRATVEMHTTGDDPGYAVRVAEELATVLAAGLAEPATPASRLPIVGPAEQLLLDEINATALDHDRAATIDALFHQAAARTPDAPAVTFGSRTLSYCELESAVAACADRLAAAGVVRGARVGVAVPRGVEMLVAVLATLELGAAYVPLDPTYPAERLRFMVDDAAIAALVAAGSTAAELSAERAGSGAMPVLDPSETIAAPPRAKSAGHDATDLAYVIYTSGSTGTPKGVMLEHRNVINFFAAMDEVIDPDPPGVWLAVTSLSFDISVLELLWTVTRGFHVVLAADRSERSPAQATTSTAPARPITFSLFYFAAGEDAASDGYRLLLESARFADRHGFEAVWTPERHFHAFGGAYPNPSVTGAALAAITTNVGIRAGSVVLPLHSPVRVAEEWAVVDNLSRGRVAISFAAGWQPNDFVLNPSAYATAKEQLPAWIDQVQRLWRGETVPLPGHDGAPVDVRTLPRPVQEELPVWLTSAGSPSTFERAGRLGVNVLTHLLGQSVDQLAENITRYRAAWQEAGHAGDGRVTLMLHTYLDRDAATAREVAREPMKSYLGTAVGLLRDVASAFPTFAGRGKNTDDLFKSLSAEEMDQLLEVAAARYLGTSGLFGTPDDAASMVEEVSTAGVDEVACLIDFGVPTDRVLASLDLIGQAKMTIEARRSGAAVTAPAPVDQDSVAELITRHDVTHLQCTPSLVAMLVADPADRDALSRVRHLLVGGEALPTALAAELRDLLPARFTNMYGPTETTIWSLTHELDQDPASGSIPIGRPIANTTIFVLDADGNPLPVGAYGELHIAGEGVARGYHNRPELTGERFVDRPGIGLAYATGDVVRINTRGYVEFAGRADNQVKIRGHRIELGEIEAVLDRHPDVVQSVVVARADGVDTRLVAYVVLHDGADVIADELRKHVSACLPDAMVPTGVIPVDAFPLTPNGKIDRKALTHRHVDTPSDAFGTGDVVIAPPADDVERLVAAVWTDELERPVGRDDNFFDIGGHSLLAVRVFRRISAETGAAIALTDVFRFPTVRTFAAQLSALDGADAAGDVAAPSLTSAPVGTDRGALRRRALGRRTTGGHEAER